MNIIAITKKNQTLVNKATKWMSKYNELNDLRNAADDADNVKEYRKLDRLCAAAFDKYLDYASELPKREVNQIEKILL
jgi:hypothetical protein